MIGLPYGEKSDDTLSRFHPIPQRNGRPDGQMDRFAISISRVSILMRDGNGGWFLQILVHRRIVREI